METEICNIVQELVIKTIPKKKKCKKAKQLSKEALKIAEKRREAKGKGEKERYTHLNAEFQRIAREIRKLSSVINAQKQRKTIEWERLEISSSLRRQKIRDTKGTFHAKMGSIKDRNGMDLTEVGDIKKSGENTQNYVKKIFMAQITKMV